MKFIKPVLSVVVCLVCLAVLSFFVHMPNQTHGETLTASYVATGIPAHFDILLADVAFDVSAFCLRFICKFVIIYLSLVSKPCSSGGCRA